jgi:hypothetical protein
MVWLGLRRVDQIDWLRGEVVRLEREVLMARERALVYNSSPSCFALFRCAFECRRGVVVTVLAASQSRTMPRPCHPPVPFGRSATPENKPRSQKAAAIAASCTIHPLRKQLFKASRGMLFGSYHDGLCVCVGGVGWIALMRMLKSKQTCFQADLTAMLTAAWCALTPHSLRRCTPRRVSLGLSWRVAQGESVSSACASAYGHCCDYSQRSLPAPCKYCP